MVFLCSFWSSHINYFCLGFSFSYTLLCLLNALVFSSTSALSSARALQENVILVISRKHQNGGEVQTVLGPFVTHVVCVSIS